VPVTNQPYGFFVGYDLEDYPQGAHLAIITDIKAKYNTSIIENARRILDTTWIIKANTIYSKDLYYEISTIINKHIGKGRFYLTAWKIDFTKYWQKMRPADSLWFKNKFGLVYES